MRVEAGRAVRTVCVVVALLGWTAGAAAQPYPVKALRIVVGSSAGGGGDLIARTVAQRFPETLGQSAVIDNRPGAGGNIGAELVARAAPDGYTLLLVFTGHAINPSLYPKLAFDTVKDFAAVTMIATNQSALVVHPSVPVRSVKDLIALARARPGRLNMASLPGSSQHLAGELLKTMARIDIAFIPYKGNGPALNDLLGGQVDLMFNTLSVVRPQIAAGRLRALAVAGEKRSALLPELPTVAEAALPGFASSGWYGFVAPAGTPREALDRVHHATAKIVQLPDIRERLLQAGNEPVASTPEQFDAFIRAEIVKWSAVVKASGAKVE